MGFVFGIDATSKLSTPGWKNCPSTTWKTLVRPTEAQGCKPPTTDTSARTSSSRWLNNAEFKDIHLIGELVAEFSVPTCEVQEENIVSL